MPCISMKQQIAHPAVTPRPLSLFDKEGSAFIIHDREDTYCPDGDVAGCAGGTRAACGIILPNGNNKRGMTMGSSGFLVRSAGVPLVQNNYRLLKVICRGVRGLGH